MYRSKLDSYTLAVEEAREKVEKAVRAHSRGTGSLDALNKANRELADAHAEYRRCYGGRVPQDDR